MPGTGLYFAKETPTQLDRTQSGAPSVQTIIFTAGGLGTADAFIGGYITNVTQGETRAIVSHVDDRAVLEGDVTTWADTDDLDIFDAWSTIQAALDQLFVDQGTATFTASQYIRIFAGTYDENAVPNALLNTGTAAGALLIIEGDSTAARTAIQLAPAAGQALDVGMDFEILIRHMKITRADAGVTVGFGTSVDAGEITDCEINANTIGLFANSSRGTRITNCKVTVAAAGGAGVTGFAGDNIIDCEFVGPDAGTTSAIANVVGYVGAHGCTFSGWTNVCLPSVRTVRVVLFNCTVYNCTNGLTLNSFATYCEMTNCIVDSVTNVFFDASGAFPEETATSIGAKVVLRNNIFGTYVDFASVGGVTKTHPQFIALNRVDEDGDLDATDPLMTDPGAGDFSLQDASPAIWAGHGSGVVTGINGVAFDPFHPDIGAWSSGVCIPPTAPSVSATDQANQSDVLVDIVADDPGDVSTIFYQSVASGLVQVWPTTVTGSGSQTITGLQTERYAFWATAEQCGLTSDSSTIDFENVAAADQYTNVQTALKEWVKGVVGDPEVIWRPPNASQPIRPYVSIKMNPTTIIGSDHHSGADTNGIESVEGDREFVFSIQVHGKPADEDGASSISIMERIRSSLEKTSIQDTLAEAGLAFVDVDGFGDLAGIGGTEYEARAFIDIRFRTTYEDTDDVGYIGTVETPVGTLE